MATKSSISVAHWRTYSRSTSHPTVLRITCLDQNEERMSTYFHSRIFSSQDSCKTTMFLLDLLCAAYPAEGHIFPVSHDTSQRYSIFMMSRLSKSRRKATLRRSTLYVASLLILGASTWRDIALWVQIVRFECEHSISFDRYTTCGKRRNFLLY